MSSGSTLTPEQAHRRMWLHLLRNGVISFGIIGVSLGIGMVGYHHFLRLGWIDAFLNASMILSSMGPVDHAVSDSAKLFAGLYALYSGVVFVTIPSLIVIPVMNRLLHRFHVGDDRR